MRIKASRLMLILTLFTAPFNAPSAFAADGPGLLTSCVNALNDPAYTKSSLAILILGSGKTQADLETVLTNGTFSVWVASGSGAFGGSASSTAQDIFCGNDSDNSVANLDANGGQHDFFFGGAGNDSVTNGMWDSTFFGGLGDDTAAGVYEYSNFYGGPGTDTPSNVSTGSFASNVYADGPTITSVTSNISDGTYKTGQVIDIRVTFSQIVNVTGTPQLTLETGSTDRTVDYSSGSGSTVLVFNYTVQAGDTSSDLSYVGISSLTHNSGGIRQSPFNDAVLTLPSPGTSNSLSANKALVIDTTAPTYSSAAVSTDGNQVILTYNENLSATTAATSAFTVTVAGSSRSISSVSISGATVILNLSSAIRQSQAVTFTYSDPSGSDDTNAIQDVAGNDAATRSSTSVTNNSTVQVSQTALTIASNVSSKSYPYSQLLTLSTSGGSGSGNVTYAIAAGGTASSCTLSSDTATVTLTASTSGTCAISATKVASGEYLSATTATPVSFSFSKASQTSITVTSTSVSYGNNLNLTSSGGSTGGAYSYTKVSGNCTVAGSILTPTATGTCVIRASLSTDTNYLAEQSADTTVTISASNVSASISIDAGTLVFRQIKTITATSTVAGKVTFKVNGKKLPGCINKIVSAPNSFTATCAYKPSTRGYIIISTTLDPADPSYMGTTTSSERLFVVNRSGSR
ncbi:Cyanobacterial long protein repeat [Candidatus Nanopelagicaceae bacterium]